MHACAWGFSKRFVRAQSRRGTSGRPRHGHRGLRAPRPARLRPGDCLTNRSGACPRRRFLRRRLRGAGRRRGPRDLRLRAELGPRVRGWRGGGELPRPARSPHRAGAAVCAADGPARRTDVCDQTHCAQFVGRGPFSDHPRTPVPLASASGGEAEDLTLERRLGAHPTEAPDGPGSSPATAAARRSAHFVGATRRFLAVRPTRSR
jgi:hypothetical protein